MNMPHQRYSAAQVTAIKTEVQTGQTFARIALGSDDPDKTARNTGYAQKAYDTARAWAERTPLSPDDAKEIGEQLECLKAELAQLANKRPAHS
jgi:hypothetical protein